MKNFKKEIFILLFFIALTNLKAQDFPIHSEIEITTNSAAAFEYFVEARSRFESFDLDSAEIFLNLAIANDSSFATAYLIKSLLHQDEIDTAFFSKSKKYNENISDGERLLINYVNAVKRKNKFESFNFLNQLINNFPFDKRVRNIAGVFLFNSGNVKDAIENFRAAIALDSSYSLAYNNLGAIFYYQSQFEIAEKYFQKLIETSDSSLYAKFNYGKFLFAVNKFSEADKIFSEIIAGNKNIEQAKFFLAHSKLLEGKYQNAREMYDNWFHQSNNIIEKESALYFTTLSFIIENKFEEAKELISNYNLTASKNNRWNFVKTTLNLYDYPMLIFNSSTNPYDKSIYHKTFYEALNSYLNYKNKIQIFQIDLNNFK